MTISKTPGEKAFDLLNTLLMLVLCVATAYPLVYVAFSSISNPADLVKHSGPLFHPMGISTAAYREVLGNRAILSGYTNTLINVTTATLLSVLLTTLGAFVVSRKRAMLKKGIMYMIVFTMFFSGGLIPSYLLVNGIGLSNTRFALIIPEAINAWNLIIMKSFLDTMPEGLEEAAKIDGANDIVLLFWIIVPLCAPVIAVMVLFYGVGQWNSWFSAMIYLRQRGLYPLQLILREILIANDTLNMGGAGSISDKEQIGLTIRYATVMVATLPVLMIYPFVQKYFVKGVMVGSIKG